jgi:cytochrome c-type biogenesis protein CcmH/NrfG
VIRTAAGILANHNIGKPREAAASLAEVVKRQPVNAVAWSLPGEARRPVGDEDHAIAAYERSAALDPMLVDAVFALGTVYYWRNDFDKASEWFGRLVVIDADNVGAHFYPHHCGARTARTDPA